MRELFYMLVELPAKVVIAIMLLFILCLVHSVNWFEKNFFGTESYLDSFDRLLENIHS